MPAICESLSAALTTNLNSLKDDKNFDNQLIVSTKRVLLSKIEYVPVQNYNSTILNNLKTKYIVLKSNSSPLLNSNGQNGHNGKHRNDVKNLNLIALLLCVKRKLLFRVTKALPHSRNCHLRRMKKYMKKISSYHTCKKKCNDLLRFATHNCRYLLYLHNLLFCQ